MQFLSEAGRWSYISTSKMEDSHLSTQPKVAAVFE